MRREIIGVRTSWKRVKPRYLRVRMTWPTVAKGVTRTTSDTEQKFRGKTDIRVTYVTNRIVFDRVYLKIERSRRGRWRTLPGKLSTRGESFVDSFDFATLCGN